jgi:hypothetical protein
LHYLQDKVQALSTPYKVLSGLAAAYLHHSLSGKFYFSITYLWQRHTTLYLVLKALAASSFAWLRGFLLQEALPDICLPFFPLFIPYGVL